MLLMLMALNGDFFDEMFFQFWKINTTFLILHISGWYCFLSRKYYRFIINTKFPFFLISDKNLPPGFPTILKNPSMKVVEKGRNAILECEAAGEPQVNIYWVKDTMRLQPNPRYTVVPTGKMRGEIWVGD